MNVLGHSAVGNAQVELDTTCRIATPEGVQLSFRLAGPGSRSWAFLIDLLIRATVFCAFLAVLTRFLPMNDLSGLSTGILLALNFSLEWGYGTLFEWLWDGQTPGKRANSLRVVKTGGYPISFSDSALRNFLRFADLLPATGAVGWISMMLTSRMQRLGDLAADTMVVSEEHRSRDQKALSFPDVQPLPLELSRRVRRPSDRLLISIDRFARRLPQVGQARANEIAKTLSLPLEKRWDYVPESKTESYTRFLLRVLKTFRPEESDGSS